MRILSALVALSLMLGLGVATASASERPIQISLLNPLQIFPEGDSVKGVRLNILYGRNTDVSGIDLGIIAGHATGTFKGLQYHWGANLVDGDMTGWQGGAIYNQTKGMMYGLQTGLVNNAAGTGQGLQLGGVNISTEMSGVMIGLVNVADRMDGLQIGLVNVIKDNKWPILPIVNWSF